MRIFQRLGLGLSSSLFSFLLVIFALFASVYFVLDTPGTLKQVLRQSGVYSIVIDNELIAQTDTSNKLLLDNPVVKQALQQAFPTSYVQTTSENNIDATYNWIHGLTPKPNYSVDVSGPKNTFADNLASAVEQKLNALPVCTKLVAIPTTPAEVLALTCRPIGVPVDRFVTAARDQATASNIFSQIADSTTKLTDKQGKPLTDKLSYVPTAHRYYIWSLYIIPAILLLCGVAIIFWSESRRAGLKRIARILIVTGIMSILLSILAVWAIGKGVHLLQDQSASLLAVQTKLLEVANLLGADLRNWWIGIGAGYIVIAIIILIALKLRGTKSVQQVKALNKSLGYNNNIPAAGTKFGPRTNDEVADTHEKSGQTTGQAPQHSRKIQ